MSLVITIAVNDQPPIALIAARRVVGGSEDDSANIYEVRRFDLRGEDVRQAADVVMVEHRYGDGAEVLARKALEATT